MIAVAAAGCSYGNLDVTGKPCPCPGGYVCETMSNTCARAAGGGSDAPAGGGDAPDGPSDAPTIDASLGCLGAGGTPTYSTTFSDFSTSWTTAGGTWIQPPGGGIEQADINAPLTYANHELGTLPLGFNISATIQLVGEATGGAVEVAVKVDPMTTSMLHCNFDPKSGVMYLQETLNGVAMTTAAMATGDIASVPGYSPLAPFTMDVLLLGNAMSCCVEGIPNATVTYSQFTPTGLGTGVGVKTYLADTKFAKFALY